jgi:hypothetical protein
VKVEWENDNVVNVGYFEGIEESFKLPAYLMKV